jgi:hypothetical protein
MLLLTGGASGHGMGHNEREDERQSAKRVLAIACHNL